MALSFLETRRGNLDRAIANQLDDVSERFHYPVAGRARRRIAAGWPPVGYEYRKLTAACLVLELPVALATQLLAPVVVADAARDEQAFEIVVLIEQVGAEFGGQRPSDGRLAATGQTADKNTALRPRHPCSRDQAVSKPPPVHRHRPAVRRSRVVRQSSGKGPR